MTAQTIDTDRGLVGGQIRRMPLQASANPFSGTLMGIASTGFVRRLTAGDRFAGVCRTAIPTAYAPAADGGAEVEVFAGEFYMLVPVSGAVVADVAKCKKVYASDDNTFTYTAAGNTYIGDVVAFDSVANKVLVRARTSDELAPAVGVAGFRVLSDAPATLTVADLDKLLVITPTAGRAITLPPAADCTGRTITVKTLATFTITLTGNAAETIDGSNTNAQITTTNFMLTVISDGAKWLVISAKLA